MHPLALAVAGSGVVVGVGWWHAPPPSRSIVEDDLHPPVLRPTLRVVLTVLNLVRLNRAVLAEAGRLKQPRVDVDVVLLDEHSTTASARRSDRSRL